ncbi:hypothetical protein GW756_06110 [bacterium]|nr:hypothetical protein [bacterium]
MKCAPGTKAVVVVTDEENAVSIVDCCYREAEITVVMPDDDSFEIAGYVKSPGDDHAYPVRKSVRGSWLIQEVGQTVKVVFDLEGVSIESVFLRVHPEKGKIDS